MSFRGHRLALLLFPFFACVEEPVERASDIETTPLREEAQRPVAQPPLEPVTGYMDRPDEDTEAAGARAREVLRERYESLVDRYEELKQRSGPERSGELDEIRSDLEEARGQLFYIQKQRNRVWEEPRQNLESNLDDIESALDDLSDPPG